ncbi:DUF805 domain-containing protein [Caulobacter sp.]|uniref:DUF805 domain-containing protein n=1 Tax=Caulobacter sp. TaxID=78 RepID=UPI0016231476
MKFLRRNLSGLTDFSGRDPRGIFWPYAGVVVVVLMLVMGAGNMAFIGQAMSATDGMPNLIGMVLVMAVEIAAAVGLLAAAVTRRLHDTGRAGYWGLAPLLSLTLGLVGFSFLMRGIEKPLPGFELFFFALFFNNLLYLGALVLLIVLLAQPSKADANRYGEPPPP